MKHWNRRKGIKILCFILVPILLALAVAGTIGVVWMAEEGVYTKTRQELEKKILEQLAATDGRRVLSPYLDAQTGELAVPSDGDLLSWRSNLRYQLKDQQGNLLATNLVPNAAPNWQVILAFDTYLEQTWVHTENGNLTQGGLHYYIRCLGADPTQGQWVLYAYVDPTLESWDDYKLLDLAMDHAYALRYWGIAIIGGCLLLALVMFINLLATASRRPKSDELFPGFFHKIPSDVIGLGVCILVPLGMEVFVYGPVGGIFGIVVEIAWLVGLAYLALGLLIGAVGRLKQGCLVKNSLIWKVGCWLARGLKRLGRWLREIVAGLPMVWRSVLVALGFGLWALLLVVNAWNGSGFAVVLALAVPVCMAFMVYSAICLRKLQKAGEALAEGDLNYRLDTAGLYGDLKAHGENLNAISLGMAKAVDERLKSERMKAELITNVSHDLKTPLTSIISYVDLLKREDIENQRARDYIEVLDRKSQRLKKLTEDLVEASKASTGAITLERERLDLVQLTEQALGEFDQRLSQRGLAVVRTLPDHPLWVTADGRHLWRVAENLLSNCAKYALEGTRVYVELQECGHCVRLTVKNISREELNIPAQRLTQRFVRGDESRTNEGSGLGLSIAQSLTELQGGQFELEIDGDLFKAIVTLPQAEAEAQG